MTGAPHNQRGSNLSAGEERGNGQRGSAAQGRSTSRHGPLHNAAVVAGGVLGATAAVNAIIAARTPAAQSALPGAFNRFPVRYGDVAYVVAGVGSPLLLLHGMGAGNSMLEWEHNFEALRARHTVYALDFLGWGASDRPEHRYTADDCIEQALSFAEEAIGEPCAVVASGDSCAYAIEAARRAPDLITRLVLVCPSLVEEPGPPPSWESATDAALHLPIVGMALCNALTSRRAIGDFAKRHLYFDKAMVDEALITRYHAGAHQRGARSSLASFLSGALRHDARPAWSCLTQPALLVWGRNALLNPLDAAPEWLALKPDARLEVVERAMLLPHAERPRAWNEIVTRWLSA